MTTTYSLSYRASTDLTFTSLASLASSSTFVAGAESTLYDNSSNLDFDVKLAGAVRVGTSPDANSQIQVWVVAEQKDAVWPDVFDGTDSAETVTNAQVLEGCGVLAKIINVVATTSNVSYHFEVGSVAALFGGIMPRKFVVFVTHNCTAALHATQTFPISVMPQGRTSA